MKALNIFIYVILYIIFISLSSFNCYASMPMIGSCGDDKLTIIYTYPEDYRIGCCGYKYVKNFFKSYGYSVDISININFEQSLSMDGCNDNYNNYSRDIVYGYSNPNTMDIYIRSIASPLISNQEREYFRIKYDKKDWIASDLKLQLFHKSVVVHEIAHLFAQHNFNQKSNNNPNSSLIMGRGVQEYIASVAQLSLLFEKEFLYYILQEFEPSIKFECEEQINSALFSFGPQEFEIMSIRHFKSLDEADQRVFLDKILSGELNPDFNLEFVNDKRIVPKYCTYLK